MPSAFYVSNIFAPTEDPQALQVSSGQTLREIVDASGITYDAGPFLVYLDGVAQPRRLWGTKVSGDSLVSIVRMPQGDGASVGQVAIMLVSVVAAAFAGPAVAGAVGAGTYGTVAGALATSSVMVAGSLAASAIAPDAGNPSSAISPTYDQNVQRNVARLGAPRAVQYGRVKAYPDYATAPYTEYENDDQYMYAVLELMLGECDVEKIEVGSVDIDSMSDTSYTVHPPGDQVTEFWDHVYQEENGSVLDYQQSVQFFANQPGTTTDLVKYDIFFPALYEKDGDGKTHPFSVDFNASYREVDLNGNPVGDGSWTFMATSGDVQECIDRQVARCANDKLAACHDAAAQSNDCLNVPDDATNQCDVLHLQCDQNYDSYVDECKLLSYPECNTTGSSFTVTRESLTPVRVTRSINLPYKARWEVKVERTSRPHTTRAVSTATLMRTRAYFDTTLEFSESTRLALRINLTSDSNRDAAGRIAVTCTAKHRLASDVLDALQQGSPTDTPLVANSLLSSALLDLATTPYGANLDDTAVDVAALVALEATWSNRGPNGEKDEFNYRFDSRSTVWEALSQAGLAGRTKPLQVAGVLSFVRDQAPLSPPSQVISERNIVAGSFSIDYSIPPTDQPDIVEAVFVNRDTWKEDRVKCDLGFVPEDPNLIPLSIKFSGITDRDHAWREGMYAAAAIYYRRRNISVGMEYEGQVILPGDVVPVTYRAVGWGTAGDVAAYKTTSNILAGDSERLSTWTASGCFISGSRTASPNGIDKSDTVTRVQSVGTSYIFTSANITSIGEHTFSVYAKLTDDMPRATLRIFTPGGGVEYVHYDLNRKGASSTSGVTGSGVAPVNYVEDGEFPGVWVRLWLTLYVIQTGGYTVRVNVGDKLAPGDADLPSGGSLEMAVFGAQVNPGKLTGYVARQDGYTQPGYYYQCSEMLDWKDGQEHEILLRRPSGGQDGPYTVEVGAEPSDVLCAVPPTFTPYTEGAMERTHLLHGVKDKHSLLCRVTGVTASNASSYTINLTNEVADVHTADNGNPPVPVDIPSLPGDEDVPIVQGLTVSVTVENEIATLKIGWTAAPGAERYIVQGSSNGVDWSAVADTVGLEYTWTPGWLGVTHVRVAAVRLVRGPWAVWVGDTRMANEPLQVITGLAVTGGFLGNSVSITWDGQPAARDYILEVYEDDGTCGADCTNITCNILSSTFPQTVTEPSYIYTYEQLIADGGPYAKLLIKVWARNAFGGGPPACLSVDLAHLAAPANLRLIDSKPATPTVWEGLAIRVQWDAVPGADTYEVVYLAGATAVHSVSDITDTQSSFSRDQMDPALGGPWRAIDVTVRAINAQGASPWSSVLSVSNPQIGVPQGLSASSSYSFTLWRMDLPTDNDYAGTRVWVWDPDNTGVQPGGAIPSNLVYDGVDVGMSIAALNDGTPFQQGATYDYLIGHYDTFGTDNMNLTPVMTETMQFLPGGGADDTRPDVPVWAATSSDQVVQVNDLITLMLVRFIWMSSYDDVQMSHYVLEWWDEADPDKVFSVITQHDPADLIPPAQEYSVSVSGLSPNTVLNARVAAIDWAGNQSDWSTTLVVNVGDNQQAPGPVTDLVASPGLNKIVISWKNPTDDYWLTTKVFKRVNSCDTVFPIDVIYEGRGNTVVDNEVVTDGTEYCYLVITYSNSGQYNDLTFTTLTKPYKIDSINVDQYFESAAISNAYILNLDGDKITANTITSAQIQAKSIGTDELNVTYLSAISEDVGTLKAGLIEGVEYVTASNPSYPNQFLRINNSGIVGYNNENPSKRTIYLSVDGSGSLGYTGAPDGALTWDTAGNVQVPGKLIAGDIQGNRLVTPYLPGGIGWRMEIGPTQDNVGDPVYVMRYWDGTPANANMTLDDQGNLSITGSITVTGGNAATVDDLAGIEAGSGVNQLADPSFQKSYDSGDPSKYWSGIDNSRGYIGLYGQNSSTAGMIITGNSATRHTVMSTARYPTAYNEEWHVYALVRVYGSQAGSSVWLGGVGIQLVDASGGVLGWRSAQIANNNNTWTTVETKAGAGLVADHPDVAYVQFFVDTSLDLLGGDYIVVDYAYLATTPRVAETGSGAAWDDITGKPGGLDSRVEAALDPTGKVWSWVAPSGAQHTPTADGLYMDAYNMGYWSNTQGWRTYMDRYGRFYLGGSGDHQTSAGLAWNGSNLTINGTLIMQSGSYGISNFSDAGALATRNSVDYGAEVTGTKPPPNADSTNDVIGGTGVNLIPSDFQLFNKTVLPRFTWVDASSYSLLRNQNVIGGGVLYAQSLNHIILESPEDSAGKGSIFNIPLEPGKKYIVSAYGKSPSGAGWQFILIGNNGTNTGENWIDGVTLYFGTSYGRRSGILDLTGRSETRAYLRVSSTSSGQSLYITGIMLEPMIGNNTSPSPFSLTKGETSVSRKVADFTDSLPPAGDGLFMSHERMGFYKSGNWTTYTDSAGNMFMMGTNMSPRFSWNASTNVLEVQGEFKSTNVASSQRIEINPGGSNEMRFYGNNGAGSVEEILTLGINYTGSDYTILDVGSPNNQHTCLSASSNGHTTITAANYDYNGIAVNGYHGGTGRAIEGYAVNSGGIAVRANGDTGVFATGRSGPALEVSMISSSNPGGHVYFHPSTYTSTSSLPSGLPTGTHICMASGVLAVKTANSGWREYSLSN